MTEEHYCFDNLLPSYKGTLHDQIMSLTCTPTNIPVSVREPFITIINIVNNIILCY